MKNGNLLEIINVFLVKKFNIYEENEKLNASMKILTQNAVLQNFVNAKNKILNVKLALQNNKINGNAYQLILNKINYINNHYNLLKDVLLLIKFQQDLKNLQEIYVKWIKIFFGERFSVQAIKIQKI